VPSSAYAQIIASQFLNAKNIPKTHKVLGKQERKGRSKENRARYLLSDLIINVDIGFHQVQNANCILSYTFFYSFSFFLSFPPHLLPLSSFNFIPPFHLFI
jgi:hypothetical protein